MYVCVILGLHSIPLVKHIHTCLLNTLELPPNVSFRIRTKSNEIIDINTKQDTPGSQVV